MKKFRMFIDARKEEKWLNEMIAKGWVCKELNAFGFYHFEKKETASYVIRLDAQSFKSAEMYEQYKQLHMDYGWRHIGGSRWSTTQYWMKATDGLDELFSDKASENSYLKRLIHYYGSLAFFFLVFGFSLFTNATQYNNLKAAYFTPGLWEKTGADFLAAFLFETPLALMRFSSPWFILICGLAFAFLYQKHSKELRENVNK